MSAFRPKWDLNTVKTLVATLPYSARPWKSNGKWNKPKLGARKVADLKKACIYYGVEWPQSMEPQKKAILTHGFLKMTREPQGYVTKYTKQKKIVQALKTMEEKKRNLRAEQRKAREWDPMEPMARKKQIKSANQS